MAEVAGLVVVAGDSVLEVRRPPEFSATLPPIVETFIEPGSGEKKPAASS
jgi:hypothetical protein